jgi:hypothetical protein
MLVWNKSDERQEKVGKGRRRRTRYAAVKGWMGLSRMEGPVVDLKLFALG